MFHFCVFSVLPFSRSSISFSSPSIRLWLEENWGPKGRERKRKKRRILSPLLSQSVIRRLHKRSSKIEAKRKEGSWSSESGKAHMSLVFFAMDWLQAPFFSGEHYRQICRLTSQGYQEPKIKPDKLIQSALVIAQKRPAIVLTAFHPKLSVHAADKEWANPLFYCSPKPPKEPAFGLKWLHFWGEKDVPFATLTLVTTEFWWSWKSIPGCCCVVW